MFKLFYPHEYVKNVFDIDYEKLYLLGYRGLIFDIDNTLVPHGDNSTPQIDNLFKEIHAAGLKTLLLTNNDEARILRFIENIDSLYIANANKPSTEAYIKALQMLGCEKDKALVIGDQLFTDIYGANKCGIKNILVQFIGYDTEINPGKRRRLEAIILNRYKRNKKMQHRLGEIGVNNKK